MPVIPFSSASRAAGAADDITERVEAEEARRYREAADAKLKELMNTPVKRFDPNGGTPMIDIPEPVTGGWRVRTNGDPQVNADALPGGAFNRSVEPELDDPVRDEAGFGPVGEWTEDLTRPAAPEGDAGFVGMGSGGPGGEGGLSDQTISDIRDRFRKRKEGDSTRELRARMLNAPNADQAAIDADLAERQGVNRLEVERNRDTFVAVDRAQAIDDLRKTAPKLRAWLDYNPANLEVAHDDVESLGWWEQTAAFFSPGNLSLDKVGQALQSGFVDKIPEQLYGLDQMLGDANASIYKALPDWFPGKFGLVNEQVQRSLMADMKRQEMAAQGKANAPVGETWLERGIYGAAQSAPSTLVSLAITAVTKSPVVGSGSMGATTAGGAYGEARDAGKSLGDAFRYALTQGGIETATEFIPLKFLVDDLAKDSSFAKTFFRQAAAEGITEQAATFLQDASTFIELNPDKTLGEFLAERPNAALETLVASTIMSGVTTTVAKGMQAAGDQLDQNAKQKRAEDLAKFIDKAVDNGANSKLLKRGTVGADKYREAVAASTDAKFRIDSDAITALAQEEGVTVEQIAQAFRIDPDEMVTAIDTGSDVLVPVGNYVAAIQTAKKEIGLDGGAIHTALGPNMRVGENDLTAREQASMASVMEAEQKARTEGGDAEQSFADAADRVRNTIREAVTATGLFNADAANTQAELVGSIVTTLAERTGQDPEALWKEQGFDIVASLKGEDTDPDGLAQSMSRQPVPIGDVELEFASKELSPQEFEAWKGARDGLSNEQIAERMNAVEPDAVVSSDDVKRWLFRSRERGYDSQKPHYNDRGTDPKTLRLIELRARGVKNPQIAAALYPEVDTQTAVNRVKALASKNKAKIEERRAALEGAKSLAQGEQLEQTQRGTFTPREDRNVIRLFESANLSTLAHEGSHWYLDTLWRMSKAENPHPFVLEQLAAILEWHGKSPSWDAMFNPDGSFTKEGVDLQEAFAESFEAYLMEGKAPTTALRSVFASFKQWLLSIYKGIVSRIGGRANLNDEIRQVFDRMLATDEAIKAVHTGLARDGEAMAKAILDKQDPDGKWKPERREKFMERMRERYAAARERAEAALMARLMDEFQRTKQAAWNDEKRQVRREAQAEVDARPEQRLYAWFTGRGWRETAEDRLANEAADEAEAMRALAQAEELGFYEANATDASIQALQAKMVENGIIPIVLLFRTTSGRVIAFPGDSGNFGMHHDMAREVFGLGDLKMQHGVWNPRKWPTIEAMNAADTAWYDTTGTEADTIAPAPAQPRVMRGEAALAQGGEGLLVYRGSGDTELGAGRLGTGLYLAEDPEIGAEWGGEAGTVDAYRVTGKLFDLTEETAQGLENYARRENTPAAEKLFARLKAEGYVGIRDPWSGHINVFDAKDMARTPENDTELGKTWTNYALEMEEDGPSLAQTVQPSRQLGPIGKVSSLTSAMKLAASRTFPTNRDFKVALQERVLLAAEGRIDLSEASGKMGSEVEDYLVNMVLTDAVEAMKTNSNAVGWYDEKVTKALRLLSLLHPEIQTDPKAKFAFVWALAVTSNGMKVNENFQLAERAYQAFKKTGKMPSDVGTGTAAKAINNSLALYNSLLETHGFEALERFMTTKTTVKAAQAFAGLPISGENLTTEVFGAAILGPKIGNGFFMNLYGSFEQLTIDRWLMRTWGRWSGSLIEDNPVQVKAKRQQLKALIQELTTEEKRAFEDIIGRKLTVGDLDAVALAITKASQKPEKRRQMALVGLAKTKARQSVRDQILGPASAGQARGAFGDEMRKAGNGLTKYLDGQNEQPGGPPERGNIRKVFARALEELRRDNPSLTMADLQALLWYPEKLVYDAAKSADRAVTSYEDDEAPDYANAAEALVRNSGVSDRDIRSALAAVDRELQAARRAAAARSGDRGRGTGGARSLAQTVGEPRQLDTMGFYSAAQEAAQRVPDGIWQMGWQAARNSLAKGRDGVVPKKTEIEYLGLDAMFGDTKLKGAALKDAVLEHIAAKRLSLVENFARVDYNAKAPAKAVMLDEIDDDTLSSMMGVAEVSTGFEEGRIVASELDGVDEFHTGLFVHVNKQEASDDLVKRYDMPRRTYSLYRGLNIPGKRELIATGVIGDLLGKAARIILDENRAKVMRKISAEAMADSWRESIGVKGDRTLVRGPGDIRLPGEDVPLFEAVIGLPEGVPGSDYRAPVSHVGGKAKGTLVTAHGEERIDDKGQRTVFVGQVQSDMAQQAREEKVAEQLNEAAAKASGINDRESAIDYMFSRSAGYSRDDIAADYAKETDAWVIDYARSRWAIHNNMEYQLNAGRGIDLSAPLLSTSEWTNVAVRSMLYRAAREGFQSISFPTAETSEIIQGNDSAAQHYETNVKGALEKLAKQLGGEVRKGSVEYPGEGEVTEYKVVYDKFSRRYLLVTEEGREHFVTFGKKADAEEFLEDLAATQDALAYILDITPAMRAKIVSEGFPLFQTGDDKGRATPPPNLPPMRLNLQAVKEQYGEQALAEIPPDVAAYSAEATDVEQFVQIARDVRKTLNRKRPKSLWKFLSTARNVGGGNDKISYRGIRDTDGEIKKIIGEKAEAPGLIAKEGENAKRARAYDMDQAIIAAVEEGYFSADNVPDIATFLDALRADIDGSAPLYARDDIPDMQEIADAEKWEAWFDQNGIDIKADVATLRATLPTVLTGQGETAIGPDEAAEVFNGVMGSNAFPTGFDLLKALKQGPLRDKLIRDLTQQRMIERNGDVFRDGTIMAEAEAYARNEVQHRQFEIELEALADAAGKGTAGALAKQTAIENLRSKQVREVLNYTQWLTLERRWAEKAIKAAAKGDTAQAAEFARYRLINSYMYSEGKKLAEKIEKAVKHAKSFDGKDKRVRLSKAGPDYIQQIDQILEGYEFKPVTRKREQERTDLRDWFAAKQATLDPMRDLSGLSEEELMAAQQEEIERSDALAAMQADANVQNYKSLTVEELMAVSDQLDMIERMARKEGALLVDGERRLLSLALDDIEAQAIKAKPDELPPESYASYAPKEKNKRGFKEFFAELRTMQSIVRMIDGIDNGPLAKNTIQKLNQAGAEGVARLRLEEERVVALFRAAYGINVDDLRKDQVRIPGVAVPLAKMERLTVALYMGTETSRKRMRDGYGWDDATLQSIINTLDAKDWAFVSSVWDYANSLYPEANQAHQDVFGVPLSKQPGLPIVTKFGVVQGNYFPIKYNPHQSSRADQQAITDTAKQITGRAGTRKATSSTKERVKGKVTMPVLLDFSITLGMHVNEVVGNITTQKAILDAGRIIAHPRTQKVIVSRHGWVTYKALMSAMRDTRNGLAGPRGPTERIMVRVRNGATNVALGLNIGTVIKQMLGYTTSIVRLGDQRTGPIAGAGWLLRGMVRMGFSASGMQNGTAFILQRSPYMRVRMQVMNQAIADQQRRINDGNIKADAKRAIDVASMFMMQRVQWLAVDGPTWLGAYEKFTASGMSEKDAAAGADQIVIDAQGSGEIFQVSAFQRGGPMQRIFTNYITAAIANWNLAVNTTRQTNFSNPGQAAIWAMNMGVLMVVPVIGSMAIAAMMSPGGGDEDEPLEEQYIREQVAFLIGPLGLFGQLGGAVGGFGYNGPQGTRAFEEASKVIMETFTAAERVLEGTATTKDAVDILRPANMAAGVWFGYPAAALDRFVRGAEALASGKTEDPKALLSGPPRE